VSRPYTVARLEEMERFEGAFSTTPVRIPLGVESFGVNAYSAREAGGEVIEEHDELGAGAGGHEELYVVLAGRAAFTLDGETVEAPPGTLVFVGDPRVRRSAVAREPETTVLVVGGVPGAPYQPSPWEAWLGALPHYTRGEYAPAVEMMRAALERHPGNPNVLYNLACVEALAGEREHALEHLRAAVAADARTAEYARTDSDLDSIRGEPGFPA
jgi:hypothetical protein